MKKCTKSVSLWRWRVVLRHPDSAVLVYPEITFRTRRTWAFLREIARCVGGGNEEEKESKRDEWASEASDHMAVPLMVLPPGLACQCFMKCCAVPVHDPWPGTTLLKIRETDRRLKIPRHLLQSGRTASRFCKNERNGVSEVHEEEEIAALIFASWLSERYEIGMAM